MQLNHPQSMVIINGSMQNALKTVFQYPQNCCNLNKKENQRE